MANSKGLTKFFLEFKKKSGDIFQYQVESTEGTLENVQFPFSLQKNTVESIRSKMFAGNGNSYGSENFDFLLYLAAKGAKTNIMFDESPLCKDFPLGYFSDGEGAFPSIVYSDITEKDMFGYEELSEEDLRSVDKGVWTNYGYRKFKIEVNDLPVDLTSQNVEVSCNLLWYRIYNKEIPNSYFEKEIRLIHAAEGEQNKALFEVYVDTNHLGKLFEELGVDEDKPTVKGRFEMHINDGDCCKIYSFPLDICLVNSAKIASSEPVALDFGTSATCAAVRAKDRPALFTLSGSGTCAAGENVYENPTNIMIYNWGELWKQWSPENENFPFFLAKTEDDDSDKWADYDSGYRVEHVFEKIEEEDGHRQIRAVLTQLKLLPYRLQHNEKLSFYPYQENDRPIRVVADCQDENDEQFNPIAFYGYLLGRAINNPKDGKLYLRYEITYPAKFDLSLRNKMVESLKYGIQRSLPTTLRDKIKVTMPYSEPEACVGVILDKYLKPNKNPQLFAVYDLGGGTMDFVLGLLRCANDEERKDEWDYVVSFLGIDGDDFVGGERLIHDLAYKIYLENKDKVTKNKIKFILPPKELEPEGFEGLVTDKYDETGEINVNLLKEKIARKLFVNKDPTDSKLKDLKIGIDATNFEAVWLKTGIEEQGNEEQGNEKKLLFKVEGVDDFLKEKIKDTVLSFQKFIVYNLSVNKERLKDAGVDFERIDKNFVEQKVAVFLSGNASKQRYVEEEMKEVFGNEVKLQLVGENVVQETNENNSETGTNAENEKGGKPEEKILAEVNKKGKSDKYKITAKTAVVFGAIKIHELETKCYKIETFGEAKPPFQFNLYNGGEEPFLHSGTPCDNKKWYKVGRINAETGEVSISYQKGSSATYPWIIRVDSKELENGKTLFLRVYDDQKVEYAVAKKTEPPEEDAKVIENHILLVGMEMEE